MRLPRQATSRAVEGETILQRSNRPEKRIESPSRSRERRGGDLDNGDLPNLFAAADGTAKAEFFTTLVSVSGGEMPALLDEDGSAVIIHENPDDHMTQPIGGSGGRIGCGVVGKM